MLKPERPVHGHSVRTENLETFSRLFPASQPLQADALPLLVEVASAMSNEVPMLAADSIIPAGYTYVGQFIDHELTFMRPRKDGEPANSRSPRFDLDSLYGDADDPPEVRELLPTAARPSFVVDGDLPRVSLPESMDLVPDEDGNVRTWAAFPALIPDSRNDENMLVAQIALLMMRLHNRIVDWLSAQGFKGEPLLAAAKRLTRWHLQWLVVNDYLPRIIGQETWDTLVTTDTWGDRPRVVVKLSHYGVDKDRRLPLEFAAAAFRFGHSMVRSEYRLQRDGHKIPLFSDGFPETADLRGHQRISGPLVIEWSLLFPIDEHEPPLHARPINTEVVVPLKTLPLGALSRNDFRMLPRQRDPSIAEMLRILPYRNLLRGFDLQLPSGQVVAEGLGITPLSGEELFPGPQAAGERPAFSDAVGQQFGTATPLWYYILKEAELLTSGNHLGPVGGRLVGEVLLGVLALDDDATSGSYLALDSSWQPGMAAGPDLPAMPLPRGTGTFEMRDLIALVEQGIPVQSAAYA